MGMAEMKVTPLFRITLTSELACLCRRTYAFPGSPVVIALPDPLFIQFLQEFSIEQGVGAPWSFTLFFYRIFYSCGSKGYVTVAVLIGKISLVILTSIMNSIFYHSWRMVCNGSNSVHDKKTGCSQYR
jgi:hypothetical protein